MWGRPRQRLTTGERWASAVIGVVAIGMIVLGLSGTSAPALWAFLLAVAAFGLAYLRVRHARRLIDHQDTRR